MRTDWTISGIAHVLVLGVAMISLSPSRLPAPPLDLVEVKFVSNTDVSKMTQGLPTAAKKEARPFAEQVAERKAVTNPAAAVAKREITASTDTPPKPAPKQPARKKSAPKHDPIADALKKDDARKAEHKKAEAKTPSPPKRNQPHFDPRQVADLLNKRDPQRQTATGEEVSDTVSLGAPKATAAQLSQNELDALVARLSQLWNPPAGAQNPDELVVTIRLRLRPDGTLADGPRVITSGQSPLFLASRDSAIRAVFRGQPFDMLKPEHYELWRDIEITFDPRTMIRG